MMAPDAPIRQGRAGEHLELLRALARELDRGMQAIARNDLATLEDCITSQQDLSVQLTELAQDRREAPAPSAPSGEGDLRVEIQAAATELQKLNLRYSILIEHSSRSAAQMAALFNSFRGQFQEASGVGDKHQTLSCQV